MNKKTENALRIAKEALVFYGIGIVRDNSLAYAAHKAIDDALKQPSIDWTCNDVDVTNCDVNTLEQFCRDNIKLAPFFAMLASALKQPISKPDNENNEPVGVVSWHEGTVMGSIFPSSNMPKDGDLLYTRPIKSLNNILDLIPDEDAKKFWKDCYSDGITAQDIANELSDMNIMLDNVPKIVYAVTGGILSKANYDAQTVISKFNDYVDDAVKEAIEDYKEENQLKPLSDDEIDGLELKSLIGNPADWDIEPKRFARAI